MEARITVDKLAAIISVFFVVVLVKVVDDINYQCRTAVRMKAVHEREFNEMTGMVERVQPFSHD